jgi:hypothetical protein
LEGRVEGEEVSDDGCEDEEEPWNSLAMSALPSAGFTVVEVVAVVVAGVVEADVTLDDVVDEAGRAGSFEDPAVEAGASALPFTWFDVVAGTDPKDFTLSVLTTGVAAGEDDKGAATSSIDPKVTADPGIRDKNQNG